MKENKCWTCVYKEKKASEFPCVVCCVPKRLSWWQPSSKALREDAALRLTSTRVP